MRHTLYCVICVLVTLLLALISLRYVADSWMLAFVTSFQLHAAVAGFLGALLALALRRHWFAGCLALAALSLGIHAGLMLAEFDEPQKPEGRPPLLKLISFNIENDNYDNGSAIATALERSDADLVFVFEAGPLAPFFPQLTQTFPYRIGCNGRDPCDTLILSRRPLLDARMQSLGAMWKNRLLTALVDVGGTRITAAAVHLTKPYFDDFQRFELDDLKEAIAQMPGPLLMAGDFNTSVLDPGLQAFLRATGFKNRFPEPASWPVGGGRFGIAIDHVFARAPLAITEVDRIEDAMGSNHYGLTARFSLLP